MSKPSPSPNQVVKTVTQAVVMSQVAVITAMSRQANVPLDAFIADLQTWKPIHSDAAVQTLAQAMNDALVQALVFSRPADRP